MSRYLDNAGIDHAIGALASRQYGAVTRAQLDALGVAARTIDRRLKAGQLVRLHSGIYAVGHVEPGREMRWLAAVLACGPGAVLSHRSAATLWTIRDGEGPRPDVTIPGTSGRRHPRIVIHRSQLAPQDRTVHAGIPVTTPTCVLFDLAHELNRDELTRTLRETQYKRRFNLKAAQELLTRKPSRILNELVEDLILTQTGLEDDLLKICDRYRLPRPLTQHAVLGRTMDFVWPDQRLVVETDGYEAHGTRTAFQTDRTTSNALQLAGYTILRFTSNDLKRRSKKVERQIRAALKS